MSLSAMKTHPHRPEQTERRRTPLFKEDRPRRIDQFISFFGDGDSEATDNAHDPLPDSFGSRWAER